MGESWACLGARVLTRASLVSVKGWYERVQGGEREPVDMVVQSRIDQVRRWHEVACHATAWHGLG